MGEEEDSMEDQVEERIDALEKRNFHLSLSITNGQELALLSGFSAPSEEVQRQEIMDIIYKWLTLHNIGVIDEVHKCTDWMMETTLKVNKMTKEQAEASTIFLTSYSIALLLHLFDLGIIDYPEYPEALKVQSDLIKKILSGEEDVI